MRKKIILKNITGLDAGIFLLFLCNKFITWYKREAPVETGAVYQN
jgi:hypothetical protein